LIPVLGLVLGPTALVLGIVAWRRGQPESGEKRTNVAKVAVFLSIVVLVTNWVGISLMFLALTADR
jgi:hypothetical protein